MSPPLTGDEAARLHEASLLAVCENVAAIPELDPIWVIAPDERLEDGPSLVGHAVSEYWPQGEGDLGQRLARAVRRAFDDGAEAVLLLGADSPTLPTRLLQEAVHRLQAHDAVLGPCEDGGYYLLAMRKPFVGMFKDVDWGEARVADQTRQRAASLGIDLIELPTWYDLDRFEDLKRAVDDVSVSDELVAPAGLALRRLIATYLEQHSRG